jgi:putative tryptophan/tyrosine transport system substrate-binding protein
MPARAAAVAAGLAALAMLAPPATGAGSSVDALPSLVRDLLPTAKRVAIFWDPDAPGGRSDFVAVWDATRAQGLMPIGVEVRGPDDLEPALAEALRLKSEVVLVLRLRLGREGLGRLAALAAGRSLPALSVDREFVSAGGLVSLASGATLVVNLKAARALGLAVPPAILRRASEVIE